jgi:hypothetical protein
MMPRVLGFLLSLISTSAPLTTLAQPPRVHFDMPYAVACREVTPDEYAAEHPGQKLVEAKLEISALLVAGGERDLRQFYIQVESPGRSLAIVDYLPKTAHEAIASSVSQHESTERTAALGINLSGKYELLTLPGPSAGIGEKKTSSVKAELLPPLETVAASGTLARGSALFFKIKATPRNLLEGTREYALVFRVPATWRADYLQIRCQAEGLKRGVVSTFDEVVKCGQRDFLVALYQAGDEEARAIAHNFARREAAKTVQSSRAKVQSRGMDWASR